MQTARQLQIICLLALLAVIMPMAAPMSAQAQSGERCCPETNQCIAGPIRAYWERNGGLPIFGYPITPQRMEAVEGQTVPVQWFERDRLEDHGAVGVLAGRLGARFLEAGAQQPLADAHAAVMAQHPDAERAAMLDGVCPAAQDVGPANDAIAVERDELNTIRRDVVAHEGGHALERHCLELREVTLLARHGIEAGVKAGDVAFGNGGNGDGHLGCPGPNYFAGA